MTVAKRFPYSTRHIIVERFTHTARALCAGKLGKLMIQNGIEDPYYSDEHHGRIQSHVSLFTDSDREHLAFAVQGLSSVGAARNGSGNRAPRAVGKQRARLQASLDAVSATHLVRTAIEHDAVPFEKVDFRDRPSSVQIESLLALGLASHGLTEVTSTGVTGESAAYYLEQCAEAVIGNGARERGFARTPRTVYTAFQEGWFQPEADGVLRPDAVQLGVQQMLNSDRDFHPI